MAHNAPASSSLPLLDRDVFSRIAPHTLHHLLTQLSDLQSAAQHPFRPLRTATTNNNNNTINTPSPPAHLPHTISDAWNLLNVVLRVYLHDRHRHQYASPPPPVHHLVHAALLSPHTALTSLHVLHHDPLLLANLSRLLSLHIATLFPPDWLRLPRFTHVALDEVLAEFYRRAQVWFALRTYLHRLLQPILAPNPHAHQVHLHMDNVLERHSTFSQLLPHLRRAHAYILHSARLTGQLPSVAATKSVYYFIARFKQPAPNLAIPLRLHTTQSTNFFQRRARDDRPTFVESVLSETEPAQFLPRICNVVSAERHIALHAFGTLAPPSLDDFQRQCSQHVFTHLDAISRVLPACLDEANAHALKSIYEWSRFVVAMQAPSHVLLRVQAVFLRTYERALPNVSTPTQRTASAIYKLHVLRNIQRTHFPLWTQFDRAIHRAFWTAAKRHLNASRSYPFLIRIFILFLFGQLVAHNHVDEPHIVAVLQTIPQLARDLTDGQSTRFLSYARKTLAERRVWRIDNARDAAVLRSLREAFDLERDNMVSFDLTSDFSDTEPGNVRDAFDLYAQHHEPSGGFYWGSARRWHPQLTGFTIIHEQDCGIHTESSRLLTLPSEIQEMQQYVSSFCRTRYPYRRLSHVNYLSTLVLETSFFSPHGTIEIHCNVYQAMVLFLFQTHNRPLSYSQITERVFSSTTLSEDYDKEKLHIRQAVLSLTSATLPLLVQHEGVEERSSTTFSLNGSFETTQDLDVVQAFQDAYLFSLDRKDEWKVRRIVDPILTSWVSGQRHIPSEVLVGRMMQEYLHPLMTKDYIRKTIDYLIDRGRLVRDGQGCLSSAAGVRDVGVYVADD